MVEVFVEAFVNLRHAGRIIGVGRREPTAEGKTRFGLGLVKGFFFGGNWAGPINDVVAATFKVSSPIERALMKFGTAGNNELFHIVFR